MAYTLKRPNVFETITRQFGILSDSQGLNDISSIMNENNHGDDVNESAIESLLVKLERVRQEAEIIATDVVSMFTSEPTQKAPNKYCNTMRRTAKELSDRHNLNFISMVNRVLAEQKQENMREPEVAGQIQPRQGIAFRTFVNIADEIFDDGQVNWGRIVAVYAFAARLAQRFYQQDRPDLRQHISLYVGKYVGNKLDHWILNNGGWECFAEYFPDQGGTEETMWKGLLFTAVGLGALASVVATR